MPGTGNLVVVHYLDGSLDKGIAPDFHQYQDTFLLRDCFDPLKEKFVYHDLLKAVFFVKSLDGDPLYRDPIFSEKMVRQLVGMKLKVEFRDGEIMYATTQGYSPARKGFFIFPIDRHCNNNKIYINKFSTVSVEVVR